jgi:hypothetical protein
MGSVVKTNTAATRLWHPSGVQPGLDTVFRWSFPLPPRNDHRLLSANPSGCRWREPNLPLMCQIGTSNHIFRLSELEAEGLIFQIGKSKGRGGRVTCPTPSPRGYASSPEGAVELPPTL